MVVNEIDGNVLMRMLAQCDVQHTHTHTLYRCSLSNIFCCSVMSAKKQKNKGE